MDRVGVVGLVLGRIGVGLAGCARAARGAGYGVGAVAREPYADVLSFVAKEVYRIPLYLTT